MTIYDFEEQLKKFSIEKAVETAIRNVSERLEDIQVEQQRAGIRSDGKAIEPDYKLSTINYKANKEQEWDHVTLHDTGQFHRMVYFWANNGKIEFGSTDIKTPNLEQNYTTLIWWFAPQNIERVRSLLLPYISSYYEFNR